jgi:hypothetical protein
MILGSKSLIEPAYRHAVHNRTLSMVYAALNNGVPRGPARKSFRKRWRERGSYDLGQHLLFCSGCNDIICYEETFWVDPWIAKHLRAYRDGALCHFLDQWLAKEPLPELVSADPADEDRKVKELERLYSALNP